MKMKILPLSIVAIFATGCGTSYATQGNTEDQYDDKTNGFSRLGLGYKFDTNPFQDKQNGLAIFYSGRYQWDNGLFIEAAFGANEGAQGVKIGYNFYNTPNWNFDITSVQAAGKTRINFSYVDQENPEQIINVTEKRRISEMLGLRATGRFDRSTIDFIVAPILLGNKYDDGVFASVWGAHTWQLRNWELSASSGIEYRSEEILNYYFSSSSELISAGAPEYNPGSGIDITAQMTATYPISPTILFETYLRYTDYADSITDSPIISVVSQSPQRSEAKKEIGIVFSYVF